MQYRNRWSLVPGFWTVFDSLSALLFRPGGNHPFYHVAPITWQHFRCQPSSPHCTECSYPVVMASASLSSGCHRIYCRPRSTRTETAFKAEALHLFQWWIVNKIRRQLMVSSQQRLNVLQSGGSISAVRGPPGQVLDTAALLTEGQLSAHVCRAHINISASGWHLHNLADRLMKHFN